MRAAASKLELDKKGDGKTVTIEALRAVFTTAAWADLKQDDSRIVKLIKSPVFKNKSGGIDADALCLFGFLNCPGDVRHKSQVLYGVMQEGGVAKQKFLSAGDKDITPCISKLMHLTTIDLVKLMAEVDGTHAMDLEEKENDIDYSVEEMVDLNYLDPLYGNKSKMSYEEWLDASERMKQISSIWYDPQTIRMLTFHRAGITAEDGVGADKSDFDKFSELCGANKVNLTNETMDDQ